MSISNAAEKVRSSKIIVISQGEQASIKTFAPLYTYTNVDGVIEHFYGETDVYFDPLNKIGKFHFG